eukprot:12904972-Prorocentrum_lima.AAC.1
MSTATLLDEIKTPMGDKRVVTQNMLHTALKPIYDQGKNGLMHLSEVGSSLHVTSRRGTRRGRRCVSQDSAAWT